MAISLAEATGLLLAGKKLSWSKYKDYKAGSIVLDKPEQRRLLEYLLGSGTEKVAAGDESLFSGLVTAWNNKEHDPAKITQTSSDAASQQSWRLDRIEAFNFGGLTTFGGKPFDLYVGGNNWCLEGQNGSGKTSLVSAILWALTGKRIREHEGPVDERGEREDVRSDDGTKLGAWPPLVAYPTTPADLKHQAEAWVRLTFRSLSGEVATAFRHLISPAAGEAELKAQIDTQLSAAAQLAEIGVLMPARLAKIGFGRNSLTLYEAVKQLTGLDQLSDIAEGSTAIGAANRKFMKYAKDQGAEALERKFADDIARAKPLAEEFKFTLPDSVTIEEKGISDELEKAAAKASEEAGKHLETLKSEISKSIDTATVNGRNTVKTAVSVARGVAMQGPRGIPLFQLWKALTDAPSDAGFVQLPAALATGKDKLATALVWHDRQTADSKLRLKALAAHTFVHVDNADAACPLCTSPLNDEQKRELAAELKELKANAGAAEQKLADVCRTIREEVSKLVPAALRNARDVIDNMDPAAAYHAAIKEKFVTDEPFATSLIGLSASVLATIDKQKSALPSFEYGAFVADKSEPKPATTVRQDFHALQRLLALVEWWKAERTTFVNAWSALVGKPLEDGSFPENTIEGKLAVLEKALDHARPLDDLSKYLSGAAAVATKWAKIQEVQKTREDIKDALEPLKLLRTLVAAETASSIAGLSSTIDAICERICLQERLTYKEAVVGRKEVNVTGSFTPGMRIDAALVANTSWLRAILWSFILALREEVLSTLGYNVLPLIVLDDPQVTFDPRNKRRWAQELVRSANKPPSEQMSAQLIVVTHERSFYQMMIEHEKFAAQQGLIGGVNKISGVATIANGGELQRLFDDAKSGNDDARAREYMRKVRIYCEDLIKFMMRSISNSIPNLTLSELREELKKSRDAHIPPFDRKPFEALINALNNSQKAIQYINHPHHADDETLGVAQAEAVKEYWDKVLLDKIHTAFEVYDTFELYRGEPRTFPWANNVVAFPNGHRSEVKALVMQHTGVAAAAKTDGRAGDGIITVEEWGTGTSVVLPNHDVFQLAAGTLDPVAGIGDLIVVSNYAKINERNLVVATSGSSLLARRFNKPEDHTEIVVLTGQSVDPYALPQPVIVQPSTDFRKIVGTLFAAHQLPVPPIDPTREFVPVPDAQVLTKALDGARLFKVVGRSAEPVALEGQFLITRNKPTAAAALSTLEGRLIVGIDESGTRYFKRLRCRENIVVLESLNPDGQTPAEVLSLDGSHSFPRIIEALEVVGVLFELPSAS